MNRQISPHHRNQSEPGERRVGSHEDRIDAEKCPGEEVENGDGQEPKGVSKSSQLICVIYPLPVLLHSPQPLLFLTHHISDLLILMVKVEDNLLVFLIIESIKTVQWCRRRDRCRNWPS